MDEKRILTDGEIARIIERATMGQRKFLAAAGFRQMDIRLEIGYWVARETEDFLEEKLGES